MDVDGMLAMVADLPETSLAMSLLDGNRKYTLVPATQCSRRGGIGSANTYVQAGSSAPLQSVATEPHVDSKLYSGLQHNSGAQAVDGRYASVYQMSHCSVHPTSPPVQLTEFPPQRAEPLKGQGNFVVGGLGSGETSYTAPTKITQAYRGAMNWPDRSVYSPRQLHHYEPDPFAHSLRKYPSLSPERSAEIVQRLINYTTMKNSSSIKSTKVSPTRSDLTTASPERARTCVTALRARLCEDSSGRKLVPDDSPTRESSRLSRLDEAAEMKKSIFGRNYDVRFVRDITRRAKENFRQVTTYPYNHPVCPPIKERYDHLPPKSIIPEITKSHMETQAEIPMVSKEVTTLPREKPSTRNIAIPLSPSVSDTDPERPAESPKLTDTTKPQTDNFKQPSDTKIKTTLSHKSIQTANITNLTLLKPRKSVQTCISSIDLHETNKIVKNCRKTKSQEEIRSNDGIDDELIKIIRELNNNYDNDTSFSIRYGLLKKLKKMYKTDRGDKLKCKHGRCVRDQLYAHADYKQFTRELSNELISKIKASNMVLKCYDPDNKSSEDDTPMIPYSTNSGDKSANGLIREWLDEIPIKTVDYLGRTVKKEQVLQAVAAKIKSLIMNKVHQDRCISLKPEILDILDDVPIEVNARNKMAYLNRIAHDLIKKIGDIFTVNSAERIRWQKAIDLDNTLRNNLKRDSFVKYDLPTDIELKRFVNQELREFTSKFRIQICASTENEIQIELVDILIDSFNDFRHGEEENIKEEILLMLSEFIQLSEHEGIYFVNNLMYNFKDFLKELHTESVIPQTFVILRSTVKNSSNQTLDCTIHDNTVEDTENNLESYTQEIVQQINAWMESIKDLCGIDKSYKSVVAHDLAEDIIDRHKYLELNPNRSTDEDELEHLKYQIFKWVNKLVGQENFETIGQASKLMRMIQNIARPMCSNPIHNTDTCTPSSCNKEEREQGTDMKDKEQKKSTSSDKNDSEAQGTRENDKRNNSSNSIFPNELHQKEVYAVNTSTSTHTILTCPSQVRMTSPPPEVQKKSTCIGTDTGGNTQTRPRSTSMTEMECPRAKQEEEKRRASSPGGCIYGNQPAPHAPQQQAPIPPPRSKPLCCDPEVPFPENVRRGIHEDYEKFLKSWVEQIPIITSNPEEQALMGLMRKGIYNGVWKALTKLQMNPTTLSNRYHYQDVLDDELEELLDLLPPSNELTKKKQPMKNQLIEKSIQMNEQLLHIGPGATYKQQLVDNVASHMPRKAVGFTGSDIDKISEDIHKINLAETFIMYTMYNKHNDIVKANVYRKKLLKQIQEFLDEYKKTHGTDAMNIDFAKCKDEILSNLYKVPSPSDETMRAEADEVMVGLEIEQWFEDLPLYPTDSKFETLCRKRYKDSLTQKVHELEMKKNLNECEDELRHEITRFMTKLPIREREIENTHFMVEELVNRLKNRPKDLVAGGNRVANFADPNDYDEFSRQMPHCSSFAYAPGAKKAQIDESSYMARDGARVDDAGGRFQYVGARDSLAGTNQWYSLQEEGGHREMPQAPNKPANCCQSQHDEPIGSAMASQLPRDSFRRDSVRDSGQFASLQQTQLGAPCCPDQSYQDPRAGPPSPRSSGLPRSSGPPRYDSQRPSDQACCPPKVQQRPEPPCCQNSGNKSLPQYQEYMPRIPEAGSPKQASQFECPRMSNGNAQQQDYSQPECCLKPNTTPTPQPMPGRSTDIYEQYPSTKTHEPIPICPSSSQDKGNAHYRKPAGSTPQDGRESRPKKREREGRPKREKKREITDSDDSVKEEVRCRCMERIWRRKKKLYPPCEECDMGLPPCFPMRFAPYPYFF